MNISSLNVITNVSQFKGKPLPEKQNQLKSETLDYEYEKISSSQYKSIAFSGRLISHVNGGAYVQENGDVNFSVWAPYAKEIMVEVRKATDTVKIESKELKDEWAKVWHTDAITNDGKSQLIKLQKAKDGIFRGKADSSQATNGDMYRYIIVKNDGSKIYRKDPRSNCQPHIFSWSKIYDQNAYKWSDAEKNWQSGKDPRKVSVLNPNLTKLSGMAYEEVHIPTCTKEGNIKSFRKEVDRIADKGFKGILLMPAEGTYDINWGYDGVDKYAISRAWGKGIIDKVEDIDKVNDTLKQMVDYCHQKGLNVGIDWVPSHIAKEYGNILDDFGPYKNVNEAENSVAKGWGGYTFNLEGKKDKGGKLIGSRQKNVKEVRKYITDIPLTLVKNYHFDFIRGDQSPNMFSNSTMKQVKAEINFHFPNIPVIWEDHRFDEPLTEPLSPKEVNNSSISAHKKTIKKIENGKSSPNHIGADELWDFEFSHSLESNITGIEIWPCGPSVEDLAKRLESHPQGTKFLLSHDESGNHEGSRIMEKYLISRLNLLNYVANEGNKHQNAADAANKLLVLSLSTTKSKDISDQKILNTTLESVGLQPNSVTVNQLKKTVNEALSFHKLGHGCVYFAPGSKMFLQGDDYGEINKFLFHRIQPVKEEGLCAAKGYDIGEKAVERSKINPETNKINGIDKFFKKMNEILDSEELLQTGKIRKLYANDSNKVLVEERYNAKGERLIAFMNFSTDSQLINLDADFHHNTLTELINSNDLQYGGDGKFVTKYLNVGKDNKLNIEMAPGSISIYKVI